jgi:hypothetical protein
MSKFTEKIPSILWIPIIVGAIALFIGGMIAFFYGIGYVEGFGSLIILSLGWIGFRVGNNSDDLKLGGFGLALGISFFALMGMALDQTGNFIYNQPLEWIFCPANSELMRETIERGARGGGVSLNQNFTCMANSGEVLRKIAGYEHFGFRFVEYVVIGYILLGLSRLYSWIKRSSGNNNSA